MNPRKLPEGRLIVGGWEVSFNFQLVNEAIDHLNKLKIDFSSCPTQAAIIVLATKNGYGNLPNTRAL